MKVVFMGTPEFACAGLEALVASPHDIAAVVTVPDKPAGRGRKLVPSAVKKRAEALGLPVMQPVKLRDDDFHRQLQSLNADAFAVVAFRILPEKIYSLPKRGAFNIHASLLPKYRGAAPINHAILNGEIETGLTSFFLTRQVDAGAIIDQHATPIGPDENFTSLYRRLSKMSGPFLLETLDKISQPGFVPVTQEATPGTPAPKIHTDDLLIDWTQDDERVHNHIRAFSEKPGAFCRLDGQTLKILDARRLDDSGELCLEPGELVVHKKMLMAGTGRRPIRILQVQPEGKRAMDAASFINGYMTSTQRKLTIGRKEVIQ